MPINPSLLVSAPILQDYLVDKDTGKPLADGIVTMYADNARTFLKNWYYQTGIPGAYTWIPLDNPLHLSSVGTIQDPNGNDVIPFFYPYEENNENVPQAYYVTVYSSDENVCCKQERERCDDRHGYYSSLSHRHHGHHNPNPRPPGCQNVLQFTRENFPFMPSSAGGGGGGGGSLNPTLRNYIVNNIYWRNIGTLDLTSMLNVIVAPSQHQGYTNGDIRFIKDVAGATDTLKFIPMTTSLTNDITPEYAANVTCTAIQLGETVKCFQYPISLHVNTLANVQASLVIEAQNVTGNINNYLDLYIYQYLGTGALAQTAPILIQRITLNNTFQKFIIPFIFPGTTGLTLGLGGDDALFLRVQYPLSSLFQINHTKPQVYLSNQVPDNDFDTYDQVEAIFNSPRTGDVRTSMNAFEPFGWVPANDGTIGDAASGATRANIDTWPLYNLLWNLVPTFIGIYNSTGGIVTKGASAYIDFTANNRIGLPKTLGQALVGTTDSGTAVQTFTTSGASTTILTVTDASSWGTATPVFLTGSPPSGLSTGVTYYSIYLNQGQISLALSIRDAIAGIPIVFTAAAGSGNVQSTVNTLGFPDQTTERAGISSSALVNYFPGGTFMNMFFKL